MTPTPEQERREEIAGRVEARFWAKVEKHDDDCPRCAGCWHWTANRTEGYGRFRLEGKFYRAHRLAWEFLRGPIPAGLQLDHLCRNRACVNPAHLEVVTGRVNTLRSEAVTAKNARKTHCKRGHEFTPENTRYRDKAKRHRECRACKRLLLDRWLAKRPGYWRNRPSALAAQSEGSEA